MENHFQLTDAEFEKQFEEGTLSPDLFSHEAHLRLAWIHIKNYGIKKAIDNVCLQIKTFATAQGAADKFNMTVTTAAVRAVYHFILKSKSTNFKDFAEENPRLKNCFKQLLDAHYDLDIFKSELARNEYVEPDLLPFDEVE
ncbi:MAG: hypothetical protein KTR26_09610 [Flammeovirgaceae bacterium]|nr:hypothetical protein [Flammeovirgaceae bacterium]